MHITNDLANQWVKIKTVDFNDIKKTKRLESIGIFTNQIVFVKQVGNLKNMIGIVSRNVTYIFRENELDGIDVEIGKVNE